MKVGFVGTGRMGGAMSRRLIEAGHDVAVYDRAPALMTELVKAGAKGVDTLGQAARYGEAVFTMLPDDAALDGAARQEGGLLESLPAGGVHVCSGTHSIGIIRKLKADHSARGQILVAAPMLGRPELVTSGQAGMVLGGPADVVARLHPLFDAIARRAFEAGPEPEAAAAIKITNNFVLGCAIEAMGEGFALTRKYGVVPTVFLDVLTDGLFGCSAYKVYGKIIAEERYLPAGQSVTLGLKDANLALAAAEAVGVPLPSGNVWRDRLLAAKGRGEGDHDWAAMAQEQARASDLK